MKAKRTLVGLLLLACTCLVLSAGALAASPAPSWQLTVTPLPTAFKPGDAKDELFLVANNLGAKAAEGPITIKDTLPEGLSVTGFANVRTDDPNADPPKCEKAAAQEVLCTGAGPTGPGRQIEVRIFVAVSPAAAGTLTNTAQIEGGGSAVAKATTPIQISATPPPFGILAGSFSTKMTEADGSEAKEGGAHPYALSVNASFPTERLPGGELIAAGHLRDFTLDLPRGLVVNPKATPVLCTEAELITQDGPGRSSCPAASAVGTITLLGGEIFPKAGTSPLYNMVPPPGEAAELGFDAYISGVFVHLSGGVRNEGDYGIRGESKDVLALTEHPIFAVRAELWGDPSAEEHDGVRGRCAITETKGDSCPVSRTHTDMLAAPLDCPGKGLVSKARADSWEETGVFSEAIYESSALSKCDRLKFKPTVKVKPTTNLTDSPSGLDVSVGQPQNFKFEGPAESVLKDITLTLPEGLVANPSQADGLAACSPEQIGLTTAVGQTPIGFTKPADSCPDAAKIGSVSVISPLVAQVNANNEVERNPDGSVIPEPLPGALYLAKPFANPFGSLLAAYLTVDDPKTGIVAKLAGEIHADPVTGQLSTSFSESPQLPIEEVSAHIFSGPRAALRTPPACASYATKAELTPWSAPDIPDVALSDPFQITRAPNSATCPTTAAGAPNAPSFEAGTITPQAGAYSPFALKLSRQDDSQPLAGLEATLPLGLTAKLAGVASCTEAQITAAKAREHPNDGVLEQASPSCPAASEIGTVDVGAGAGPTPFHVGGRVYLAGPYKGAPLSAVIITPAVAGPFDLGTVVVRAAIYVNPDTALVRTVSDPLPSILDGIPLDLRSAAVRLGRSSFTLNPTSCEPKSVAGVATSIFGQAAALSSPFQVGGCKALPYKPKLHTRLFGPIHRGGHPRLRSVFEAKPGEANTARISFALPHSEFIDQAHFRTICTRVQFAANQCPAGSIYGHVKAITPLFDYPLEGPVYLRSSSHKLPDVVAALRGPASQPIEVDLDGRVDSVNGGIRTTFEVVPDAPVTKAIVTLQGGKKGLFQNSTNICKGAHLATLKLTAQSGKRADSQPPIKADCKKGQAKKRGAAKH